MLAQIKCLIKAIMCGIAGFLSFSEQLNRPATHYVQVMCDSLRHRGPKLSKVQRLSDSLTLGHNRLPIIDLNDAADQPMHSSSKRFAITFNGEIYNFLELRKELERSGSNFKTSGDTEAILELVEKHGLDAAVEKLNGMFAFALWDAREQLLYLVRDRLGVKPLYVAFSRQGLLFASEIDAMLKTKLVDFDSDTDAIGDYFKFGYTRHPRTIYRAINAVPPASIVTISLHRASNSYHHFSLERPPQSITVRTYWSILNTIANRKNNTISQKEVELESEALFRKSMKYRLISDVPVGCFLSGGFDSTLVAALASEAGGAPLHTFSVGFPGSSYDETLYSNRVAKSLDSQHHLINLDVAEFTSRIGSIPSIMQEPFGDFSIVPQLVVSELAKRYVTVVLSGDGGDELLGSYQRHRQIDLIRRFSHLARLPKFHDFLHEDTKKQVRVKLVDLASGISGLISILKRNTSMGSAKAARYFDALFASTDEAAAQALTTYFADSPTSVGGSTASTVQPMAFTSAREALMYQDFSYYLPCNILTKLDRASMRYSLEAREPFLDYKLFEFIWSVPLEMRFKNGSKWPLSAANLSSYTKLINPKKKGFGFPLGDWILGPLREYFSDHLSDLRAGDSVLNSRIASLMLEKHLRREGSYHAELWMLLNFRTWEAHRNNLKSDLTTGS